MILRAAWVVPVDAPPIRDGCVYISGGRITRIDRWPGAARPAASPRAALPPTARSTPDDPSVEAVDLSDCILTPGLVNPHTHLELTCYGGATPPAPFWSWFRELIRLRGAPDSLERERGSVCDGAWRSLRSGVTCVGDISRRNVAWPELKRVPIRKVCFAELLTIADHPPRNPDELRAAVADMVEDDLLTIGITPHAPYSVPGEQVRAAVELADELRRPWCAHWAETREENAFVAGRRGVLPELIERAAAAAGVGGEGCGSIAYLERCTGGQRAGALAHVNYVSELEIEQLAARRHVVMYCPRAHAFFGHARHPIVEMRRAGVTVALGTDSLASNQSLSLLEEARFLAARTQREGAPRSAAESTAPEFRPDELLRMITLDAACALRLEDQIGSITAGKWADLAAFRVADPRCDDPFAALLAAESSVAGVWVAGRRVV